MLRPWALAATLLLVVLAGCSSPAKDPVPDDADFEELGLQATATTGVLRGVVVDEGIRPVAGVLISLAGSTTVQPTTTGDNGTFGFDGLEPGTYFITANRSGFREQQTSATVLANVPEPPIVRLLLIVDPTTAPRVEVQVMHGFITCSVRPMILAQQCGFTDEDVVQAVYPLTAVPDFIQSEMIWESTQAFGAELSLSIRCLPGDNLDPAEKCPEGQRGIVREEGNSPQIAQINRTLIDTWALGLNPLIVDLFAFGRSDLDVYDEETVDGAQEPVTGKPCLDWSGVIFPPGTCVRATGPGAIVNQKVDVYTHVFYGYLPPEGWTFINDGTPPGPPE